MLFYLWRRSFEELIHEETDRLNNMKNRKDIEECQVQDLLGLHIEMESNHSMKKNSFRVWNSETDQNQV